MSIEPVAWKLRTWLIRFLAGRHCVVINLVVKSGTLCPGEATGYAFLENVCIIADEMLIP